MRLCSSFRRKPESIFAFAFSPPRSDVFMPGRGGSESNIKTKGEFSGFRIQTPRDNKIVAAPPGEKSKWIPAFAGMTGEGLRFLQGRTCVFSRFLCPRPIDWAGTQVRPYGKRGLHVHSLRAFSTTRTRGGRGSARGPGVRAFARICRPPPDPGAVYRARRAGESSPACGPTRRREEVFSWHRAFERG